jgi:hypothetical protein
MRPTSLALLLLASCSTPSSSPSPTPAPSTSATPAAAAAPKPSASHLLGDPLNDSDAGTDAAADPLRDSRALRYNDQRIVDGPAPGEYVGDAWFVLGEPPAKAQDNLLPQPFLKAGVAATDTILKAFYNHRFEAQPDRTVLVFVYKSAAKLTAETHKWAPDVPTDRPTSGIYWPVSREIDLVFDPSNPGPLASQIVFPLLEADFPLAPVWLRQGLSGLYTSVDLSKPGEIHGKPGPHLTTVRSALSTMGPPNSIGVSPIGPQSLFLSTTFESFRGDETVRTALAGEFMRWLDEQQKLWDWYHRYRATVATDPTGVGALQLVLGKTVGQIEEEWKNWIRSPAAGASK